METRPLREGEIETFVDELWLPFQREIETFSDYTLEDNIWEKGVFNRQDLLSDGDSITYLTLQGQQFLGYVTAEIQTPPPIFQQVRECHIGELFVPENARRQGVASELLDAVEKWAKTHGCKFLNLNVDEGNKVAQALYEDKGYAIERLNMRKHLANDG